MNRPRTRGAAAHTRSLPSRRDRATAPYGQHYLRALPLGGRAHVGRLLRPLARPADPLTTTRTRSSPRYGQARCAPITVYPSRQDRDFAPRADKVRTEPQPDQRPEACCGPQIDALWPLATRHHAALRISGESAGSRRIGGAPDLVCVVARANRPYKGAAYSVGRRGDTFIVCMSVTLVHPAIWSTYVDFQSCYGNVSRPLFTPDTFRPMICACPGPFGRT